MGAFYRNRLGAVVDGVLVDQKDDVEGEKEVEDVEEGEVDEVDEEGRPVAVAICRVQ